ncbi:hypothetical protein FQR65_LT19639 [Abscondita terminalis]|nr:hypothetical protein FQR65_LT19639 [Abscondita terminalis]
MIKSTKRFDLSAVSRTAYRVCSSTAVLPAKHKKDLQRWSHLDILRDTVPGMSVDRAYEELIKGKKGKKVIVGVIDSGVEIDHEDLKAAIWTNPKEKQGTTLTMIKTYSKYLKKEDITKEDVDNIPADAPAEVLQAKNIMYVVLANNLTREKLEEYKEYYDGQEKYNLNVNFDGRSIVGDNPADINDTNYGNNDVLGDRKHAKTRNTRSGNSLLQTRTHKRLGGDGVRF